MRLPSLIAALCLPLAAFELPEDSRQCVVGIAPDWNSSKVTLTAYEKKGGRWVRALGPWPGRLGKSGMAWGDGLHPVPAAAATKKEGDWKAPAGVFRIGGAWGYDASIRKHPKQFYRQITTRDLWVEDSSSSSYNRHLILDHDPATEWEKKQQMRQNDHAHSLKLFIAHNAPPRVTPGKGSAIFFHIWRGGGSKPTAGCTTLAESNLRNLIAWLDPDANPLYVLLPESDYRKHATSWQLP
ncbi:L,D-transpeptidase [Haloferula sp. A504]|uniref:L,D-transpeptidase n=1 Tax=Haloferula sp. A504 TaxID=3373601 RepID=UPI0031C6EA2F|nr:L,D-transpeptidase family protein [Verrucomicrobiaceae bacterium E54]